MTGLPERDIICIDEELCDGCGLCVPACAEGAIQIVDDKARLVKDRFCDGLGACLGDCPRGAITIVKREAEAFDEEAVEKHLRALQRGKDKLDECLICPSAREIILTKEEKSSGAGSAAEVPGQLEKEVVDTFAHEEKGINGTCEALLVSELTNWPVQLKLVSSQAKFLQHPHLLIAAHCVPFAFADFHRRFLRGKVLLMGCPKLDDASFYEHKLEEIFRHNSPQSVTVLTMEVPCCSGLDRLVENALEKTSSQTAVEKIVVGIDGGVRK